VALWKSKNLRCAWVQCETVLNAAIGVERIVSVEAVGVQVAPEVAQVLARFLALGLLVRHAAHDPYPSAETPNISGAAATTFEAGEAGSFPTS
jgi:hypothetical protein